jgi:hypothetical protein
MFQKLTPLTSLGKSLHDSFKHMFSPPKIELKEASGNYVLAVVKMYYKFNKQIISKYAIIKFQNSLSCLHATQICSFLQVTATVH